MTSRERVRAILNHKEADKIPIDFGGMHSSGMSAMLYNDLRKYLGISGEPVKVYDVNQQLALPERWYLDRFQIDVVDLARTFDTPDSWKPWTLPDGSQALFPAWIPLEQRDGRWLAKDAEGNVLASMGEGMFYFDQEIHPYFGEEREEFSDLNAAAAKVSWMSLSDQMFQHAQESNFYEQIGKAAKQLYESTDYCITANYGSLFFEPGQWLYRNDEFFMKLLTEPEEVEKLFEALLERHLKALKPYLEQVDGYADVLILSDDLGMQSGPLISPQLYRDLIKPWHAEIFKFVKENSHLKTFLHSCGSIVDLIPDLIDAGLDIINPVQIQTTNMAPEHLKNEFGSDIVFWGGGIDTQHNLPNKSPEEVKEEVTRNCKIFMKDGGFVFTAIHNMLPGIPPENIVAMYDAVNAIRY
jgi:uroporphyrinogen decarboxylase